MNYRSPELLVQHLDLLAEAAVSASLAIHCGDHTELLPAGDPANVGRLTELMEAGHHPMAFVAMNRQGGRLVMAAMPLVEVEKLPGIDDYLRELIAHHRRVLAEDGVAQGPRPN